MIILFEVLDNKVKEVGMTRKETMGLQIKQNHFIWSVQHASHNTSVKCRNVANH